MGGGDSACLRGHGTRFKGGFRFYSHRAGSYAWEGFQVRGKGRRETTVRGGGGPFGGAVRSGFSARSIVGPALGP